jgi:hypothetical protein
LKTGSSGRVEALAVIGTAERFGFLGEMLRRAVRQWFLFLHVFLWNQKARRSGPLVAGLVVAGLFSQQALATQVIRHGFSCDVADAGKPLGCCLLQSLRHRRRDSDANQDLQFSRYVEVAGHWWTFSSWGWGLMLDSGRRKSPLFSLKQRFTRNDPGYPFLFSGFTGE